MKTCAIELWRFLNRREKWRFILILGGVILAAVLETIGVALLPLFIACLGSPKFVIAKMVHLTHRPEIASWDVARVTLWMAGIVCVFFLLKNAFAVWLVYLQGVFKSLLHEKIGRVLLTGYLNAPYVWHVTHSTAEIQQNIQHEINHFVQRVVSPILTMAGESAVIFFVIGLLLWVSPVATLVTLIVVCLTSLLYTKVYKLKLERLGGLQRQARIHLFKCLQDSIGGIKELKVLGRLKFYEDQYDVLVKDVVKAEETNVAIATNVKPVMEVLAVTVLSMIVIVSVLFSRDPQSIFPSLALFAVAAVRLLPSANRVIVSKSMILFGIPSFKKIMRDLAEIKPFVAARVEVVKPGRAPWIFNEEIRLSGVGYRYPQAHVDSLVDVTTSIKKGQSIAFIGASGAGKTTLVDLILGLLQPTRGTILVDGRDIQEFIPVWQHHIGYIPQAIYLSEESLRLNVAFGLPPGEIDDARVWKALQAARLDELVRSWPEQLDRLIGEKGVRLSGGQRQRIGIARAFYHDPAILVLDEATAALDNETEREIISVLDNFRGQKTLMMIAHRLTTVQRCDRIFLMSAGRIVAEGSYDELQRNSVDFQRMLQAVAKSKTPDIVDAERM